MTPIIDLVAQCVGLSPGEVVAISLRAPKTYKMYRIAKKTGGTRTIFHPAKETKALQYGIMYCVLGDLPVHEIAVAYRHGVESPVKNTARKHADLRYTVHLDFRDFFPSILPKDLLSILMKKYPDMASDDKDFLKRCLFVSFRQSEFLSIGAPSSPMISNAVMYGVDEKMQNAATATSSDSVITRYADDITFSTNKKGGCSRFVKRVEKIVANTSSPRLVLNEKKTQYASTGSSRHVLGLTITPEGVVTIGRSRKRMVRALSQRVVTEKCTEEERRYLKGYLSFCEDVEPGFINSLVVKYGRELLDRLSEIGEQSS